MKRSEFIKKVLKSKANTVFTTKEQVENSLEIFEKLGMLPPPKSVDCVTDYLLYAYYDRVENVSGNYEEVNVSLLWDKED